MANGASDFPAASAMPPTEKLDEQVTLFSFSFTLVFVLV